MAYTEKIWCRNNRENSEIASKFHKQVPRNSNTLI